MSKYHCSWGETHTHTHAHRKGVIVLAETSTSFSIASRKRNEFSPNNWFGENFPCEDRGEPVQSRCEPSHTCEDV